METHFAQANLPAGIRDWCVSGEGGEQKRCALICHYGGGLASLYQWPATAKARPALYTRRAAVGCAGLLSPRPDVGCDRRSPRGLGSLSAPSLPHSPRFSGHRRACSISSLPERGRCQLSGARWCRGGGCRRRTAIGALFCWLGFAGSPRLAAAREKTCGGGEELAARSFSGSPCDGFVA